MQLPQELDFLKSLDKYKSDEVLDIDLGNGDIFSFKLLSTDEQLKATQMTSSESAIENQIHYILSFRKNVMALSLVKVNGNQCPKPETMIYDDEGNPVGLFLDIVKDKFGEIEESFFNTVAQKVENFQGKMVNDSLKKLGVKLEDLKAPSLYDYEQDIQRMEEEDNFILEQDQEGSLEGQVRSMADFAFSDGFQQQQEDLAKRQQELEREQEEINRLKVAQYQAQMEDEATSKEAFVESESSNVVSQKEYFDNKNKKGIGSVSKPESDTSPTSLYNYPSQPSYPKSVRKG